MSTRNAIEELPATALRPCYDIHKSYSENAERGPQLSGPMPERLWPPRAQWRDFLGFRIASPLGIPAGPLLNAKWISFATQLGYDVVTYKTIRSHAVASHPVPNVVFVNVQDSEPVATQLTKPPQQMEEISITNSFGNPSRDPDFLQQDIQLARDCLHDGQILIVSVFGTGGTVRELASDYAMAAVLAKHSGAHLIEANFSCPNLSAVEGSLYSDSQAAATIAQAIVQAIHPMPLIVKMGAFASAQQQKEVTIALARAGVRAICGINTIPMTVKKEDGTPALPGRPVGGICGNAIRPQALQFVQQGRQIIDSEKLDLALLGCGGIVLPEHFDAFLNAGADIAMTATGMMWDPYLAMRWHYLHHL